MNKEIPEVCKNCKWREEIFCENYMEFCEDVEECPLKNKQKKLFEN